MQDAPDSQGFRDLDEEGGILQVGHLSDGALNHVERDPEELGVGLANMEKGRGHEGVHHPIQLEGPNPTRIART
jgi:hypothetical protein